MGGKKKRGAKKKKKGGTGHARTLVKQGGHSYGANNQRWRLGLGKVPGGRGVGLTWSTCAQKKKRGIVAEHSVAAIPLPPHDSCDTTHTHSHLHTLTLVIILVCVWFFVSQCCETKKRGAPRYGAGY